MESMRPRPEWNESWQKEFLGISGALKPEEVRILKGGPKSTKDVWIINLLYKEYKILKKIQEDQEQ